MKLFRPAALLLLLACLALTACAAPTPGPTSTATATLPPSSTFTPPPTATVTLTPTPSATTTPTASATPTPSETPTQTITPTYAVLRGFVNQEQVMCFYGPSRAYLFKYALIGGSRLEIIGRVDDTGYIQVRAIGGTNPCWMNLQWMDVQGDINTVQPIDPRSIEIPWSRLYAGPSWVKAERNGNEVTVTWSYVWMTEDDDRGYLLDVFVCKNGKLTWTPVEMQNQYQTLYTYTDEPGCTEPSNGRVYAVEKHGYTKYLNIQIGRAHV